MMAKAQRARKSQRKPNKSALPFRKNFKAIGGGDGGDGGELTGTDRAMRKFRAQQARLAERAAKIKKQAGGTGTQGSGDGNGVKALHFHRMPLKPRLAAGGSSSSGGSGGADVPFCETTTSKIEQVVERRQWQVQALGTPTTPKLLPVPMPMPTSMSTPSIGSIYTQQEEDCDRDSDREAGFARRERRHGGLLDSTDSSVYSTTSSSASSGAFSTSLLPWGAPPSPITIKVGHSKCLLDMVRSKQLRGRQHQQRLEERRQHHLDLRRDRQRLGDHAYSPPPLLPSPTFDVSFGAIDSGSSGRGGDVGAEEMDASIVGMELLRAHTQSLICQSHMSIAAGVSTDTASEDSMRVRGGVDSDSGTSTSTSGTSGTNGTSSNDTSSRFLHDEPSTSSSSSSSSLVAPPGWLFSNTGTGDLANSDYTSSSSSSATAYPSSPISSVAAKHPLPNATANANANASASGPARLIAPHIITRKNRPTTPGTAVLRSRLGLHPDEPRTRGWGGAMELARGPLLDQKGSNSIVRSRYRCVYYAVEPIC
jgi:hypothetical protein